MSSFRVSTKQNLRALKNHEKESRISSNHPKPLIILKYNSYKQSQSRKQKNFRTSFASPPKYKTVVIYHMFHFDFIQILALDSQMDSDENLEFFNPSKSLWSFKIKGYISQEDIFILFRFISRCSQLRSLDLVIKIDWDLKIMKSLFKAVETLSNLRGLRINSFDTFSSDTTELKSGVLEYFIQEVKEIERIEYLIIDSKDFHYAKNKVGIKYKSISETLDDFYILKLLLTSFSKIENMELDLSNNKISYENEYSNLWAAVYENQSLKALSINFTEIHDGTCTLLNKFSKLRKIPTLTDLIINFTNGSPIDVETLFLELTKFQIQSLVIILNGIYIRDNYKCLSHMLEQTKTLKRLDLNSEANEYINDEDLIVISRGVKANSTLEELLLNFKLSVSSTGLGVCKVIEAASAKKEIVNFQISVGDCFISWEKNMNFSKFELFYSNSDDKDIQIFNEVCKNYSFFENVTIIYSNIAKLEKKSFKKVSESISRLKKLKDLHIQFCLTTNLIPEAIENISQSLIHLANLRVFHLFGDFDCYHLTDEYFNKLSSSLQHLIFLEELKLRFTEYHEITQIGILNLLKSVKKLELLQILCLELENVRDFGDESFIEISRCLKVLGNLKVLDFSITCDEETPCTINQQSASALCKGLKSLWQLESLILIFPSLAYFDDETLKEFETSLVHLSSLKTVNISILNSNYVTKDGVENFKRNIKRYLPSLEEIVVDYEEHFTIHRSISAIYEREIVPFEISNNRSAQTAFKH